MASWRDGFAVIGGSIYKNPSLNGRIAVQDLGSRIVDFYDGTTYSGGISVSGGGTNFGSASDYRIKENIVTLSGAILKLNSIPVYKGSFIQNTSGTIVDMCIAHELQPVVPHCVTGEKDAIDASGNMIIQMVDYAKITPLLVANIKEQTEKLQLLEARLSSYLNFT